MKKVFTFILTIFILFTMSGCDLIQKNNNWKEVTIDGIGTLTVPIEWNQGEFNNLIYFYIGDDKENDDNIVLFQIKRIFTNDNDIENGIRLENCIVGENAKIGNSGHNVTYSNGVCITDTKLHIDGAEFDSFCVDFPINDNSDSIEFFSYNNKLDFEIIKKVAKSFMPL